MMNGQQNEFSSFKLLLKQVYSAHTSKVKELENEVKILKEKLIEKIRESNNVTDCKRCIELEEAFKSCKKALHEQSKLFETFGEKFSIFNSSGSDKQDSRLAEKSFSYMSETSKFSKNFKTEDISYDKDVLSGVFLEKVTSQNIKNDISKISATANPNLLKKVMCDNGSFENSEQCTVTFHPNFKAEICDMKSNSSILVPDSLDICSIDTKKSGGSLKNNCIEGKKCGKLSVSSNCESSENTKICELDTVLSCKRLSSDSLNEDRIKRCNKSDYIEDNPVINKMKNNAKTGDINFQKTTDSDDMPPTVKSGNTEEKKDPKDKDLINAQITNKDNDAIILSPDEISGTPKNNSLCEKSLISEVKSKSTPYQPSPSLLPMNTNAPQKLTDIVSLSNDNDDFQEQASNNKLMQNEDSWDTCDKRKSQRKKNTKSIKCSSKFKMTLDAPPLNYKKPTYKQVKLSKSLFQPKNIKMNSNEKLSEKLSVKNEVGSEQDESDFPVIIIDNLQTSTPCEVLRSSAVDIDATFIPENFKHDVSECATTSVKKNAVERLHLRNGSLFSNISFPVEPKAMIKLDGSSKEEDIKEPSFCNDDTELKENMNSFDRLPVLKEPNYKYKNDVVRKKLERKQLNAFDCNECEKYYSELGLSDKEKKKRMKKCSRHRGKFTPPATPEHFWELDFPDTQECKARGYMNETQKVKLSNLCDI